MNETKKKQTTILALRYGISHAQGVSDDVYENAAVRERVRQELDNMQTLHEELTGYCWVS